MHNILKLRKKQKRKILGAIVATVALIGVAAFVATRDYAVLNPKGTIAQEQRDLLMFATILSLFVIVPVFILTFYIVWKFREKKQSKYTPEWEGSRKLEVLWWGIPTAIILVLSIVTWQTSHSLDPFKPLTASTASPDTRPITIQVVALPWKWLFIYPEQNIASVNYVQFPVDTPVHFQITSDAAMNSFWIPQLGGQIYAMAGMSTSLHLQANELGRYNGSSANLSGEGFSGMRFAARATTREEFDLWSATTHAMQAPLDQASYNTLASPSSDQPVSTYRLAEPQLYNEVINHYMTHGHSTDGEATSKSTNNYNQKMEH